MHKGIAILSLALCSAAAASTPYAAPGTIFACSIGQRNVSVTRSGDTYTYRYGTTRHTEKTIIGSAARHNLFWHYDLFPHSATQQMRFSEGRYSYVLYVDFMTPNYEGKGARDEAGIVVFNGTRRISTLHCQDSANFELTQEELAALPADTAAYSVFE